MKTTASDPSRQAVCLHCNKSFVKRQVSAPGKYCSRLCRRAAEEVPSRACNHCRVVFRPKSKTTKGRFCSMACKAEWQRANLKPVNKEWLHQKYVVEGLDCVEIGTLVCRDPKSVWNWLKDFGIPTRKRGHCFAKNPAFAFWKHGRDNPMKGRKASPETRARIRAAALADGRVPYDPAVGSYMKGRKGADTPNWKGGVTPERQAFYSTKEWKRAARTVWKRDDGKCQRCRCVCVRGKKKSFDIHHVVSFAYAPLRAEPSNLILLCDPCHNWVHSNTNINKEFIKEIPQS